MRVTLIILFVVAALYSQSQVAINNDGSPANGSAMLDVSSTEKGILIPRLSLSERNAISIPASGLMIYQTDNSPGFYYNSGTPSSPSWLKLNTGNYWSLTGNSGTTPGTNFIGTLDNSSLVFKVYNAFAGKIDPTFLNTSLGLSALSSNMTGNYNSAFGADALQSNIGGMSNTAIGYRALYNNVEGNYNSAFGNYALSENLEDWNTAAGYNALRYNTLGTSNSSFGYQALYQNTSAGRNTSVGANSLYTQSFDAGGVWYSENVALGYFSLYYNQPTSVNNGIKNTAAGTYSLFKNTTGSSNTAHGNSALFNNTSGNSNVAVGVRALYINTVKSNLVAVGDSALYYNGSNASQELHSNANTAVGSRAMFANSTGFENTATGFKGLYSNTTGFQNSAFGSQSLLNNTTGMDNSAAGAFSLMNNTVGHYNTAMGVAALSGNTSASMNTAVGRGALSSQSYNPGYNYNSYNTAIGYYALGFNQPTAITNGVNNTAIGAFSMYYNTTGKGNTAAGGQALYSNTSGSRNIAIGQNAMLVQSYNPGYSWSSDNVAVGYEALTANQPTSVSNGIKNTATGTFALHDNTTGNNNTAVGYIASQEITTGFQNTSIGANSMVNNTTGSYNTAIGYNTGPTSTNLFNTTCVGIDASASGSDMVRIGNIYVGSIGGYQNWTNVSDGRFKENITEEVPGLDFISLLRPVTYQLNRDEINEFTGVTALRQQQLEENPGMTFLTGEKLSPVTTGFIAQEVEMAARSLGYEFSGVDTPDNDQDLYGLRYAEFVVPLVKAVQEQQHEIEQLNAKILELERKLEEK